jgi:hypothetical protein
MKTQPESNSTNTKKTMYIQAEIGEPLANGSLEKLVNDTISVLFSLGYVDIIVATEQ